MDQEVKAAEQLERETEAATLALSRVVRELMDQGTEPASLAEALASALGVMLAAAPRHMADNVAEAIFAKVKQQMRETWAEVDQAEPGH